MRFETKYKLMLLKNYVGKGQGETGFVKWLLGFYGLYSRNIIMTISMGIAYAFLCLLIGWMWFKWDWTIAEAEVGNRYNLFTRQMRKKVLKEKA